MERLSPAVLESFGVCSVCSRNIKKIKGHYLCSTDNGLVKVHITSEPPEAILQQHSIKEYLAAMGFPWTGRFQLTKSGQPYVLIGRETYVMTSLPQHYREIDIDSEGEVLQAFKSLAHFHIAAQNMPQTSIPHAQPLPETYTHQINELNQAGKQARRSPRLSDFDVSFIKHAPHYKEIMEESIARLQSTNYTQQRNNAITHNHLCHNSLKEENLLSTSPVTHIINFSNAVIDTQLSDIAALVRRYAQRSSKSIPIGRLLQAYDKVNPLPQGATDILHAQLRFPWAFMKIVTQYYSKKRNWTPNGLLHRMNTILAERERYNDYIQM